MVVSALYAGGIRLVFLTDVGLFLIPDHVLLVVHAVSWGALPHRGSLYERYESYLRCTNGQEQERQWAVAGPNAGPRGLPERPTVRHHAINAGRLGEAELSTHGVRDVPEALVLPTRRRSA